MKDNLDSLAGAARDLGDRAREFVGDKADALREGAARLANLGALAGDASRMLVEDVNSLMPAIQQAGYEVHAIDVDLAIPPKIAMHCRMQTDLADDDRTKLLAAHEGNRLTATAVRLLLQVSDLRRQIKVGKLQPTEVVLEVGLSPGVRIHYRTPSA